MSAPSKPSPPGAPAPGTPAAAAPERPATAATEAAPRAPATPGSAAPSAAAGAAAGTAAGTAGRPRPPEETPPAAPAYSALPYSILPHRPPQLGLIALQADETVERDMRAMLPDTVELLVSRVPSGAFLTTETIAAMEADLARAAALFPAAATLSGAAYACTSGAAQIGPARVAALVGPAARVPRVTDPLSALIDACGALGVARIALLSPYAPAVSAGLTGALARAGISLSAFASFEEEEEGRVARIDEASILAGARHAVAAGQGAQAAFLSCTNLRTLGVIAPLEAELGLPVLSSNQALAWRLLGMAGVEGGRIPGALGRTAPPAG